MTSLNTPAASQLPTPCPEPVQVECILTVPEVTTIFLRSLVRSAENVLGCEVHDAVISVPSWFDNASRTALEQAASDADLYVLQLLDSVGAVIAVTNFSTPTPPDSIQLIVGLGYSSLELTLLAVRQGLACVLASSSDRTVGGSAIDEKLMTYFANEFTKKTKTPLTVCPASTPIDRRAEAKPRLAVEHTKRTLSTSPGAAACSVESLKDGIDFTGSINRLRFDVELHPPIVVNRKASRFCWDLWGVELCAEHEEHEDKSEDNTELNLATMLAPSVCQSSIRSLRRHLTSCQRCTKVNLTGEVEDGVRVLFRSLLVGSRHRSRSSSCTFWQCGMCPCSAM